MGLIDRSVDRWTDKLPSDLICCLIVVLGYYYRTTTTTRERIIRGREREREKRKIEMPLIYSWG